MKYSKFRKDIFKQHWIILYLYFGMILVFAGFYFFSRDSFGKLDTFGDSIYFSIVTITTLGYGDILPINSMGKFMVSLEAITGVILLGFFLIRVSLEVVDDKEKKRIDTLKLNFKEQYKIWRGNTINALVHLSKSNLSIDEEESLCSYQKFKDYFSNDKWSNISNNLSDNVYYTQELLHELEFLQRNIETLIMLIPIENIESLKSLNRYINGLYKMRKYDLDESDERKVFMRTLWEIIALYDSMTGSYGHNYLLETVDSL